ncbi:MAG TPA: 4-hydroxythreonine-4-phosphate dehydrogenase PdxA [Patescibacteria group bacterium]|nr:4-hydroxythreonine-4-phosphate dehydrogenase PdxA [Patescibacteria group bacterium]
MSAAVLRPLAVTMGEPAGIGGDITLAAWMARAAVALPPFFVIDDAHRLTALAARLGLMVPIARIDDPAEALALFGRALPVLHRPLDHIIRPGLPDAATGPAVVAAIAEAVRLTMQGRAGGVVTNPIHKKSLYDSGFRFPGHTEYLAELAGSGRVVMMLSSPQLRVVPVTIHLGLRAAIDSLTTADIVAAGQITADALHRDLGIEHPRIAVAGLNPHAGEGGSMGREDIEIVAPAIAALRAHGVNAFGPLPADTMFHPRARAGYDVALCMYHDQALIPIKTIDFDGGVNVTLGLPFVRTSPDHGTALDLAGSGKALPDSLIAALRLAGEMVARRG